MWKQDLEALLKIWPDSRLIKKLEAVFGGIAITDTSEDHWFYDHNEGTLTKKGPWKKNHKEPKPKAEVDNRVHIKVVEGINYPYFSVVKTPEGGPFECYNMDEEGFERLKQKVNGREIVWEVGRNVFAERELTAEEADYWISKYLRYVL